MRSPTSTELRPSTPKTAGQQVYKNRDLLMIIAENMNDSAIQDKLSTDRSFLEIGMEVLGKRKTCPLSWVEESDASLPYHAAKLAAIRILTVRQRIGGSPTSSTQAAESFPESPRARFSPETLASTLAKCPKLREVRSAPRESWNVGTVLPWASAGNEIERWRLDIRNRSIRVAECKKVAQKADLPEAYWEDGRGIEECWDGYTVERRIKICLDYDSHLSELMDETHWIGRIGSRPDVRSFHFCVYDGDGSETQAGANAAIKAMQVRREAGVEPFDEIYMFGEVLGDKLVSILPACKGTCRALVIVFGPELEDGMGTVVPPEGTVLRLMNHIKDHEDVDIGIKAPSLDCINTPVSPTADPPAIEIVTNQCSLDVVSILTPTTCQYLTVLDLDQGHDENGQPVWLDSMGSFLSILRNACPALRKLRFAAITSSDMDSYKQPRLPIPNHSWPGSVQEIDMQVCIGNVDLDGRIVDEPAERLPKWHRLPYLEIAMNLAYLCANADAVKFGLWPPLVPTEHYEAGRYIDGAEFGRLMTWLLQLNEKQQRTMRHTDWVDYGLYPMRPDRSWRDITFDDQNRLVPLDEYLMAKKIRRLRAIENGSDSSSTPTPQDAANATRRLNSLKSLLESAGL